MPLLGGVPIGGADDGAMTTHLSICRDSRWNTSQIWMPLTLVAIDEIRR